MKTFIKAAEVWQPDHSRLTLTLNSSHYGDLKEFANTSECMVFRYGEGLPGRTWAERKPLLWNDLTSDQFMRSEIAERAGISCGLSIPIFAGEFLMAVIVLFCGKGDDVTGAVEIWNKTDNSNAALKLTAGYYGELEQFEWISRRLTIMKGRGLPGTAWSSGKAEIFEDLAHSNTFLRARNAAESGITTGLALPIRGAQSEPHILTFLSAQGTPIARRFEIWSLDKSRGVLCFENGHCEDNSNLAEKYNEIVIGKGEGMIGQVWLTGSPMILPLPNGKAKSGMDSMLLIPMIEQGQLTSVVAFVY